MAYRRKWMCCSIGAQTWIVAVLVTVLPLSPYDRTLAQSNPAASDSATTSTDALDRAKARALELMRAGRFAEAITPAEEALRQADAIHGSQAIETAVTAHNLGFLLRRAGRDEIALSQLERALAIYEQQLPAVHEDTRNLVGELGQIYVNGRRGAELAAIYRRLMVRAEAEGYAAHVGVAHMATNLGFVLRGIGQHEESEASFRRAVPIYEAIGAVPDEPYRLALEALLDRLAQTRRGELAIAAAQRALTLLSGKGSAATPLIARLHNRVSRLALEAGKLGDARAAAEAAIATAGAQSPPRRGANELDAMTEGLNNLARAHRAGADFAAAEATYKRALPRLEAAGDTVNTGILMDNIAVLALATGRATEAEQLQKRAAALIEQALGPEHHSAGKVVANLGATLSEMRRFEEAEPLLRRALAVYEAQTVRDPVTIAIATDNLAGLLRETGRFDEARTHYQRALALFESVLPKAHPRVATARNNVGRFLLDTGAYALAERELRTALSLSETADGAESPATAVVTVNLAEALMQLVRLGEARQLYSRALAALEAIHGPEHVAVLETLIGVGRLELADANAEVARTYFERATTIAISARNHGSLRAHSGSGRPTLGQSAFHGLIEVLWRTGLQQRNANAARALEVAQWDTMTSTANALAALGARSNAREPELGALVRERQDSAAAWLAADKRLSELLAQTRDRSGSIEVEVRARLTQIGSRLAEIDGELARRYPRYHALASPTPLPLPALQQQLSPNEAALQFLVMPDATFVWVITKTGIAWHRVPIKETELANLVRALRCGLDRSEWIGNGQRRCATLLGLANETALAPSEPLPFDTARAHGLYRLLLAPLEALFEGRDLLVVASGALTSLPLQILIDAPPREGQVTSFSDVAWLGRRRAISVVPSLASLASLRGLVGASRAARPYIGVGNPLLTGADGTDRSAFEAVSCGVPTPAMQIASAQPRPTASVIRSSTREALRRQPPLPETTAEICRVATAVGADPAEMLLGHRATEAQIKALSREWALSNARILHFATHGLLAGEAAGFLAGKPEPALLLTPPETATDEDDGLLTASEVSALKLDADWVVLSACNTAGGETTGAEPLSGLARAFFYAGARALLVSHWAVDSASTVELMTGVFNARAREPGLTEAKALRRAMTAMIERGGNSAHPSLWSPFVVVGGSTPSLAATAVAPLSGVTPPLPPNTTSSIGTKPTAKASTSGRKNSQRPPPSRAPADDWRKNSFGQ